ncbi:unnamed protein product [Spodoptera littoralis]|uniref:THAP-type domain-containing protein n=1 Tax=Spodoptera littoralis TaxID=7109 RepID=A0A9P0MY93_SPOLI|nr:unnamed protein product [Spodoptera littoralis]CAH1634818.1 unnamed protein product [Spodoptera littoralis]
MKKITKIDNNRSTNKSTFPQNKELRQKWLKIIGLENINPELKVPKVCSQHFPESAFNRTLDVIRLRDDVVPLIHLAPSQNTHEPDLYEIETGKEDAVSTSSIESQSPTLPVEHIYIRSEKVQHQPSNLQKNEKIQELCKNQRKEIKKLRERIRRRDQKILKMENVINDLKKRDYIFPLRDDISFLFVYASNTASPDWSTSSCSCVALSHIYSTRSVAGTSPRFLAACSAVDSILFASENIRIGSGRRWLPAVTSIHIKSLAQVTKK